MTLVALPAGARFCPECGTPVALRAWGEVVRSLEGTPPTTDLLDPALAASRTFLEHTGVWDDLHLVHGFATTVALEAGDDAAARELLDLIGGVGRLPRALRGHRDLLRAWLAGRQGESAGELFAATVEHYEVLGSPVNVAHTHRWWADWLLAQDRRDEAAPHLAAARATYERLGASAWLAGLDGAAAEVHTPDTA